MFRPGYLSTRYSHPLDRTIRRVNDTWYVRWYVKSKASHVVHAVTGMVTEYALATRGAPCKKPTKASREEGTRLHAEIERHLNRLPARLPMAFVRWCEHMHVHHPSWQPFRTEMVLRSSAQHRLLGVVDCIFFRVVGDQLQLWLLDWKFQDPSEFDGIVGGFQVNVYRHLLESCYRVFVVDGRKLPAHVQRMSLVHFPDHGSPFRVHDVDVDDVVVRSVLAKCASSSGEGNGVPAEGVMQTAQ